MNIGLLRWWKNIESIVNNPGWSDIRAGFEKQLPSATAFLASRSTFARKLVIIAATSRIWRYFSPKSTGRMGKIIYCAPTLNNKKSINRVQELCGLQSVETVTKAQNMLWFFFSFFKMFAAICSLNLPRKYNIVSLAMFAQYLQSYFYFLCAMTSSEVLKGALVANDHSPFQCGFIAAAERRGLKLVYVQHAHVTAMFPALKFDLALLYGSHAKDIYKARGSRGEVFLIGSGKPAQYAESGLLRMPAMLQRVGIALTNLPPTDYLLELIAALKKIEPHLQVFLRAHPRAKPAVLEKLAQHAEVRSGTSVSEDAQYADVFICGNSSIAMELLKCRVPVAVSRFLDDAPQDYYGFIRNGVVPSADPVDSGWWRRIVQHYAGGWCEKAAYFDASFEVPDQEISFKLKSVLFQEVDDEK